MIKSIWGQKFIDMGDRFRMNIFKMHLQPGKHPQFSINGKLLRKALKEGVTVEVAFPERYGYVLSKTPTEWLKGHRVLKKYNYDEPMDFYYHDVPLNFPREGRKKELYQAVGQVELLR